jgi:hypothetical protein
MSDELANAAAILFLAGAAFYLAAIWALFRNTDDGGRTGCGRRGCGRSPAGIGCNHQPPADGSAARRFHEEED